MIKDSTWDIGDSERNLVERVGRLNTCEFLADILGIRKLTQPNWPGHMSHNWVLHKAHACDNVSFLQTVHIKYKMKILEKYVLYLLQHSTAIVINQIPYKWSIFQLRTDKSAEHYFARLYSMKIHHCPQNRTKRSKRRYDN